MSALTVGRQRLASRSRRRRSTPLMVIAACGVLAVIVVCVIAPFLAPHDPARIVGVDSLQGPSSAHWLGTDQLGRDVFSRMVAGARTALLGPLLLALGTTTLATALAIAAGYGGGWVDALISRVIDLLYSVPALMVAVVIVGVTGGGYVLALAVLLVFGLPQGVRLLRSVVIERVGLPYVEAAQTLGMSHLRVVMTQILPTIMPFVVATFFLQLTYGIVDISSLSFLGLGTPPGSEDWGRMVAENRSTLSENAWAVAGPGIALIALAVSVNLVGDWIYTRYEEAGQAR